MEQKATKMKKNNIVLIGMPGVGKSTVGVILAKVLGYQFSDADLLIQQQEGKLLKEIIAEEIIDFPDTENVFGRALIFRQHYKKKFGENIDLNIQKVEWLQPVEGE